MISEPVGSSSNVTGGSDASPAARRRRGHHLRLLLRRCGGGKRFQPSEAASFSASQSFSPAIFASPPYRRHMSPARGRRRRLGSRPHAAGPGKTGRRTRRRGRCLGRQAMARVARVGGGGRRHPVRRPDPIRPASRTGAGVAVPRTEPRPPGTSQAPTGPNPSVPSHASGARRPGRRTTCARFSSQKSHRLIGRGIYAFREDEYNLRGKTKSRPHQPGSRGDVISNIRYYHWCRRAGNLQHGPSEGCLPLAQPERAHESRRTYRWERGLMPLREISRMNGAPRSTASVGAHGRLECRVGRSTPCPATS